MERGKSGRDSREEGGRREANEGERAAKESGSPRPVESRLSKAGEFDGDLRDLPKTKIIRRERPEHEDPFADVGADNSKEGTAPIGSGLIKELSAPAPAPLSSFIGLDYATWGAGHPPDTNGDVGKNYFIQSVNSSVGIYKKSDGSRAAAFTLNAFMSQGNFGNLCDTDNYGDPVVLYDTFEDRWVISDFAFKLDASSNVVNPPGNFQCIAVSKTGDPVAGGWNYYSINTTGGLGDYPKFGVWNDGIYMMVNMFGYASSGSFQNTRVYAFNKAQMYAGKPTAQVISFNAPSAEFTILPANARLQTGAPPVGSPNYFAVVAQYTNAVSVYKFHADWDRVSLSSFTGPFLTLAPASWAAAPSTVPALNGNGNDTLATRLMAQNQYTNIGGVESLWNSHTVQGSTTAQSAVRYYQVNVTGGTLASNTTQATTYNPDAVNRYVPSIGIDRAGDMALGFSASSSTLYPAIRYAGRLATDPLNTVTQTDTDLIAGTGSQSASYTRWGDYSSMTLDPDGCTFWQTSEYYATTGTNWQTRIGSFTYPSCTPVGAGGTVSGTVTIPGGAGVGGATVKFGSRTATTDVSGNYSFTGIPAGTYPSITVSYPGDNTASATPVAVADGGTTTQNFALTATPTSASLTDTTAADFQLGTLNNVDLTTSSGNTILAAPTVIDQQNTNISTSGNAITITGWAGQTFKAGVSGSLVKADVNIFCSGCTGTAPNLTLSVRATSGGLPTGSDLATATITGSADGGGGYYPGTFTTPLAVTAGTTYALIVRPTANPSAGTYAVTRSTGNVYANGARVTSANSGSTWTAQTTDLGFDTYIYNGYAASGDLTSGLKDANPAPGRTVTWNSLTWNATVPANTSLKFQLAASNSDSGPFNFVGPDGTAATYYTTSGSTLAPVLSIPTAFNNNRYLEYKAYLTTTDTTVTPTLNDVTVSYTNSLAPTAAGVTVGGRATTASGEGIRGVQVKMTDGSGTIRTAVTGAGGAFQFTDVPAGATYVFTVKSKRFEFAQPTRVANIGEDTNDLNFVANQ